jgi:hypothetical protein
MQFKHSVSTSSMSQVGEGPKSEAGARTAPTHGASELTILLLHYYFLQCWG